MELLKSIALRRILFISITDVFFTNKAGFLIIRILLLKKYYIFLLSILPQIMKISIIKLKKAHQIILNDLYGRFSFAKSCVHLYLILYFNYGYNLSFKHSSCHNRDIQTDRIQDNMYGKEENVLHCLRCMDEPYRKHLAFLNSQYYRRRYS